MCCPTPPFAAAFTDTRLRGDDGPSGLGGANSAGKRGSGHAAALDNERATNKKSSSTGLGDWQKPFPIFRLLLLAPSERLPR
jgi:hypothetical protein